MASRTPAPGQFIGGLIAGFAIGGIVLMPIAVIAMAVNFNRSSANTNLGFILIYVLAAILGVWGIARIVVHLNFLSGLIAGAAAGLLGLTAICQLVMSGLGQR
jgi:hypothetical protein